MTRIRIQGLQLVELTFPVDQAKTNLNRPFISRPVTGQIHGETSLAIKMVVSISIAERDQCYTVSLLMRLDSVLRIGTYGVFENGSRSTGQSDF